MGWFCLNLINAFITLFQTEDGLKILPKITSEHVFLTTFSVMRVSYAVQVLSRSMATVLREFGGAEASETGHYCELMDRFFDCVNVRSIREGDHKRNPDLKPYYTVDDERLHWLEHVFLKHFIDWKKEVFLNIVVYKEII